MELIHRVRVPVSAEPGNGSGNEPGSDIQYFVWNSEDQPIVNGYD